MNELEIKQIKKELAEVRYYYLRKKKFADGRKLVGVNSIEFTVEKYNEAVKSAPAQLYDIYIGLYVEGNTQTGYASELGYSPIYIYQLNRKLIAFFQNKLKEN